MPAIGTRITRPVFARSRPAGSEASLRDHGGLFEAALRCLSDCYCPETRVTSVAESLALFGSFVTAVTVAVLITSTLPGAVVFTTMVSVAVAFAARACDRIRQIHGAGETSLCSSDRKGGTKGDGRAFIACWPPGALNAAPIAILSRQRKLTIQFCSGISSVLVLPSWINESNTKGTPSLNRSDGRSLTWKWRCG